MDWCYHGTVDETLAVLDGDRVVSRPGAMGPQVAVSETTAVVPFNDADALDRRLAEGDVACLLMEPAEVTERRRVPGDVLVHLRRARDHLDRHYAEEFDLDLVADLAGLSRYHFLRSFALTYGQTPAAYLAERRIERAQDLLRAANLTVTEVCHAVGYSSLGSFSSTFREIVGDTPSAFQARYAAAGNPRIPGCYVFMAGLVERAAMNTQQSRRSAPVPSLPRVEP